MHESPLNTAGHRIGPVELRFLGLHVEADGTERYAVSVRDGEGWRDGRLRVDGEVWHLESGGVLPLGSPDEVFALAAGGLDVRALEAAVPYWPVALQRRLARRRTSGACTVAFDARWFLERLATTAVDVPLVLLDASRKLRLAGLLRATKLLQNDVGSDQPLLDLLERALCAGAERAEPAAWTGEGRLIGESTWGELAQVGDDLASGSRAARGTGVLSVTFAPDEPMGLGFGPRVPSEDVAAGREPVGDDSVGTGAEVGGVEPGGAAALAGVREGMVVRSVEAGGARFAADAAPFEDVLQAIDDALDAGEAVTLVLDTAAPFTHWYAVEMPAAPFFATLAGDPSWTDAGVTASFDALCGEALLWREPIPRVFLGAPGSVTCAHVDICPQLQLAHGLAGTKVLGVASHGATARLRAAYGEVVDAHGDVDEGATHVPTDRPLSGPQAGLLTDPEVSLVLLRPGDLVVLHSGALHFASNGADGVGAALYHGVITPPAVPRLREDAAGSGGWAPTGDGAYAGHLFAADLLRLVEERLTARRS